MYKPACRMTICGGKPVQRSGNKSACSLTTSTKYDRQRRCTDRWDWGSERVEMIVFNRSNLKVREREDSRALWWVGRLH